MTKDVFVAVKGFQISDETDEIETICEGEYFETKDSRHIVYEEHIEGYDKPVINRIKIKEDEITVTKKGPCQVQMIFIPGKSTRTQYITPFGSILLELDTKLVDISNGEDELDLLIKYGLSANDQFVSNSEIMINIKSKK